MSASPRPGRVDTGRGVVDTLAYPADGGGAVVLVGGIGGGFDSPARGLYVRLGETLPAAGVSVLRVRFRHPGDLEESVFDVRAAVSSLSGGGATRFAIVGHSFGGAVAISAGAAEPHVATVVTLSTQSYGAQAAADLDRPLLLVHGEADPVLPPGCSVAVHRIAKEPKELVVLPGTGHNLDEEADRAHDVVFEWLVRHMR